MTPKWDEIKDKITLPIFVLIAASMFLIDLTTGKRK